LQKAIDIERNILLLLLQKNIFFRKMVRSLHDTNVSVTMFLHERLPLISKAGGC